MTSPWSRGLALRWLPTPRIYDRRSRLVELLDEDFGVIRFRVMDSGITVVLGAGLEISVNLESMAMHSVRAGDSELETGLMCAIANVMADELHAEPTSLRFAYQHLLAWPDEAASTPGEAFAKAASAVLSPLAGRFDVLDSAILFDGARPNGGTYQVEFGVVEEEQAPLRLGRMIGRGVGLRPTQHDVIMAQSYPTIATFVDSTWPIDLGDDRTIQLSDRLADELVESEHEANQLALGLHEQILGHPEEARR